MAAQSNIKANFYNAAIVMNRGAVETSISCIVSLKKSN